EPELARVAPVVGQDEPARPADVGPLGADAVVLRAAADADLVEQVGWRRSRAVVGRCRNARLAAGRAVYRLVCVPVWHTASSMRYRPDVLPRGGAEGDGVSW